MIDTRILRVVVLVITALVSPLFAQGETLIGVSTHIGQNKTDVPGMFQWLSTSEFRSIRDEIYWQDVEQEPGVFVAKGKAKNSINALNKAADSGLHPLVVLDYGNKLYDEGDQPYSDSGRAAFGQYCYWLARQLSPNVKHFEIWNEWNHGMGTHPKRPSGSAQDYVKLAAECSKQIKKAKPDSVVLGGAVTNDWGDWPWLTQTVRSGLLDQVDGVSIHLYNFLIEMPKGGEAFFMDRLTRLMHALQAPSHPLGVPIYVTEVGWPNHQGPGSVSEEMAADAAVRFYLLSRTVPQLKGIWFYELRDSGTDPNDKEHHFGMLRQDNSRKPISCALTQALRALKGMDLVETKQQTGLTIQTYHHPATKMHASAIWQTKWTTFSADKRELVIRSIAPMRMVRWQCDAEPTSPAVKQTIQLTDKPEIIVHTQPISISK